jgi:hypothetical protein
MRRSSGPVANSNVFEVAASFIGGRREIVVRLSNDRIGKLTVVKPPRRNGGRRANKLQMLADPTMTNGWFRVPRYRVPLPMYLSLDGWFSRPVPVCAG